MLNLPRNIYNQKIALVQCPAWGRQNPPLAISLLGAFLKSKGKDVLFFDLNNELFHKVNKDEQGLWQLGNEEFWNNKAKVLEFVYRYNDLIDDFVYRIINADVNVIGCSVFSSSKEISLLIAAKIKNIDRAKKIVFGGPQCAAHMQGTEIISNDAVDIVVNGEGEEILNELLEKIDVNGDIGFCEGTWLKKGGKIVYCGNRENIKDLNDLPFANFESFSLNYYNEPFRLPVYLSRGCINRCVYCNENLFWKGYRSRSGERTFREMRYQLNKHRQVKHFDFVDSLVNGSPIELSQLADFIIDDDLKITWAGQAIVRSYMTPELCAKLKRSGCICLAYGIESGSQKVLNLMRKNFSIEVAEQVIRDTHNAGIDVVANFMFGFPGETREDFTHTLDFIIRNNRYISTVNPSLAYTTIGVGTYLYEHAEEFNVDFSLGHLLWKDKNGNNTYEIREERYKAFCKLALSLGMKFSYPLNV